MRIAQFLDDRLGHRALFKGLLEHPVVGGPRWARMMGSALVFLLVLEAVTGWLLMTVYSPSTTTAWASVHHIDYGMESGWVVRGLHHFGAHAMVVLCVLHLVRVAVARAYTEKRDLNWLVGLALLGLVLAFVITGNMLPWDQDGYWGARTELNIAGTVPIVGPGIQQLIMGGPEPGHLTLTRFYSLHTGVLPAIVLGLTVLHIALVRRHARARAEATPPARVEPYFPRQALLDVLGALLVLGACFALTFALNGAPLDAPADPSSQYPAKPEWYFAPLSHLLGMLKGKLTLVGAVGLPGLVVGYLVALPFVDRAARAGLTRRMAFLLPLALVGLGGTGLFAMKTKSESANEDLRHARKVAAERGARSIELATLGVPPEGPLAMLARDPEIRGADLFVQHCVSCHRLGDWIPEEEATAPDLTGFGTARWAERVLTDPDADDLFGNTPFAEMMPSSTEPPKDPEEAKHFKPTPKRDLEDMVDFLVAQANGDSGRGMRGEELVRNRCTSCHRLDGETDDEDSLAPELRGWGSRPWIEAMIENPGSGKTYPPGAMDEKLEGHMPGYADQLSPLDLRILAIYVHRASRR